MCRTHVSCNMPQQTIRYDTMHYINVRPKADKASLICRTEPNKNSNEDKNSSGDEIANVNFFYNIAHVEASAYSH